MREIGLPLDLGAHSSRRRAQARARFALGFILGAGTTLVVMWLTSGAWV